MDIARELMHAHRKFLAELVGYFPDRWENKAVFYNESGEKLAEQTVAKMMVMLTEHMQEHISMIEKIFSAHPSTL
ncbi:MAG: hypothetical protein U9R53_01750 [Chloroflexota bacterium]|nr:hypothetical protein [Chloroflexota bacterium]